MSDSGKKDLRTIAEAYAMMTSEQKSYIVGYAQGTSDAKAGKHKEEGTKQEIENEKVTDH